MASVMFARGRVDESRTFTERAIDAAPNWSVPRFVLGAHQVREGRFLDAIRSVNLSMRLNPRAPVGEQQVFAMINFAAGRTAQAVQIWERVRSANPDALWSRVGLAAYYESAGRHDEARQVVREILAVNPQLTSDAAGRIGGFAIMGAGQAAELRENLRKARLP